MQHKKLTVTILTDKTSWMNKFDTILESKLNTAGHDVACVSHREDLRKGDIAFLLSCFEIVKPEYLNRNAHNIVVHASKLPAGKGWSPTTWQILEGKNEIPLTLFEATDKVDAGPVYARDSIRLNGDELIDDWQTALGEKIVDMCCDFAQHLATDGVIGIAQEGEESFYPRRCPVDSRLDANKTISEQFNLLRVVDNEKYPAYFEKEGHRYTLKIYRSDNA